jgi:uncharacterized membrane protein YidH (DUF202 family)
MSNLIILGITICIIGIIMSVIAIVYLRRKIKRLERERQDPIFYVRERR